MSHETSTPYPPSPPRSPAAPPAGGPPVDGPPAAPPSYGVPPAPDPRRSPTGRALLGIGVVLGVLLVAWGALHLVDWALTETRTSQESYAAADEVELIADGDVTVRSEDGATQMAVEVVSRGGLAMPEYSVDDVDGALVLANDCPAWTWWSWTCAGELHAVVPAETVVTVRTSNGEVRAEGLVGDVDLRSSNGDVDAVDVGGSVAARTSNGDIEVARVDGAAVLETSNGEIDAVDVSEHVAAESSNGDVTVRDVGSDTEVRTSNGEVEIAGVAGNVFAESSNGTVTVFGDGEPVALTIDTSNGEEIIEGATDPGASRTVEIRSSNGDVAYLAP